MPVFVPKLQAQRTLAGAVRQEARQAANGNKLISKPEQENLSTPLVSQSAQKVRADGGKGARVVVNAVVDEAMSRAMGWVREVNQSSGRGAKYLSQKEIREVQELDPAAGDALFAAYQAVRGQLLAGSSGTAEPPPPVQYTEEYSLPDGWAQDFSLATGSIAPAAGGGVDISNVPDEDPDRRGLVHKAFDYLWDAHLQYRYDPGYPVKLGWDRGGNGELRVGQHTDPTSGKEYAVADWVDIDDGSYTLYFERKQGAQPDWDLRVVQFSN